MLRIALIDIFMFSLPFLIYGAYMLAAKGAAPTDVWQDARCSGCSRRGADFC